MQLLWPGILLLLGLIPLMMGAYIWVLRRRRSALRYSSLSLVRAVLPRRSSLRRHIPIAFFLVGLGSLVIALGRPISIFAVPTDKTTIILTIDVSRSMCSTDISPSRIEAAEAAAISFIQGQKSSTQIGIVAFSGFAELIQAPTTDQQALIAAIQSLTTGGRTAIGSGILKALDGISEIDPSVAPSVAEFSSGVEPPPVPKGAYAPDIVILLTDGASNAGPLPLDAAQQAADRAVRVYSVGFGTADRSQLPRCPVQFLGGEPFCGGGFGGGPGGGPGGGGVGGRSGGVRRGR